MNFDIGIYVETFYRVISILPNYNSHLLTILHALILAFVILHMRESLRYSDVWLIKELEFRRFRFKLFNDNTIPEIGFTDSDISLMLNSISEDNPELTNI